MWGSGPIRRLEAVKTYQQGLTSRGSAGVRLVALQSLKNSQKSKINLDRARTTYTPYIQFFFWKPITDKDRALKP